MNTHSQPLNERISALMDGDLPAAELDALLDDMARQDSAANDWHLYHLVGDVLRSNALAPQQADMAFWGRLEQRLAQESVFLPIASPSTQSISVARPSRHAVAANGSWRWVAGASFAVLAGVLSMGMWEAFVSVPSSQLAGVSKPALNAIAPQDSAVMLRDPELDALMAAHQQMGGHSAWQMPSGFLRNATYERPAR